MPINSPLGGIVDDSIPGDPNVNGYVLAWNDTLGRIVWSALTLSAFTGASVGRIPFGIIGGALGQDSNLFWDNTNKYLGIGTSSPAAYGHFASLDATRIPLIAQAFTSQSASLQEWRNVSGTSRAQVLLGSVGGASEHSILRLLGATSGFLGDLTAPALQFQTANNGFYLDTNRIFIKANNTFVGGFTSTGWVVPTGTATAPSISLNGDGNTGLYGDGADGLGLTSGGTARLWISSAGNLGIGTTSPASTTRLTVAYSDNGINVNTTAAFSLTKTIATDNGNAVYANTNTITLSGAGAHLNAVGTMNYLVLSGAAAATNTFRGTYSRAGTAGTTNASTLAMYVTHFEGDGTGTIANWYGYTVGSVGGNFSAGRFTNNTQTITNTYGIYIGDITSGTQTNTPWAIYQDDTGVRSWLASPLFIGGTVTNPTALLDLGASTTARAPLRLRSGTAPTTPNDGDIWFDGTNVRVRVAGVTKTFTIV